MKLEKLVAWLSPHRALKRAAARQALRYYEASQSSNYHKAVRGGTLSADSTVTQATTKLRSWARYLDENHDLTIGILNTLCDQIVGRGLNYEPMVRRKNGALFKTVNDDLRELWGEFWTRPEVTGELSGSEVERMVCRSWLRDGEVFIHDLIGVSETLRQVSRIPYQIELLEADFVPFDLNDDTTTHGVRKDTWGRPTAYNVYLEHPGNMGSRINLATKQVSADFITHLKFVRRIRQTRGVPLIHGIIHRLDDIKDYEESERIAARVAASLTAYIRRSPDLADVTTVNDDGTRPMEMQAGMILDGLAPGEEIGTVGTDRPNTGLADFRDAMLRACASGTGTNYSSISKNYDGTYSAQRQEMVESTPAYQRMRDFYISQFIKPVWDRFVEMSITAGLVRMPKTVTLRQMQMVDIRGPGLPWIDPKKEVEADGLKIQHKLASRSQIIRERGGDPLLVAKQIEMDVDLFGEVEAVEQAQPPPAETDDEEAA